MSLLRIRHETVYSYKNPVRFGPHRLVLRPREGHDIHVNEMVLEIEPKCTLEWSRDVFGNSVATAHFLEAGKELRILNRVVVSQSAEFPLHTGPGVRTIAFPVEYSPFERGIATAYQTTAYPRDVRSVLAWLAAEIDLSRFGDAEAIVSEINRRIRGTIKYVRREAKGVQSPAETLSKGTGSCRDMATLLLEALRALGFPARFASGYLDCLASEAGHASTHAWAEAYLPEIGWLGWDPTSGERTSARHVVTGVSNHPRGVMPVSGSFFGKKEEYEGMKVSVQTTRMDRPTAGFADGDVLEALACR